MSSTLANRPLYIPKWLVVLGCVVLVCGVVVGAAVLVVAKRHHSSLQTLTEVPQSQVVAASAVARQYGTPQATTANGQGLTILFYYDGYTSSSLPLRYVGLLEGALKTTEPYASATSLSTHVITSAQQQCHVVRKAQNILQCNSSLLSQINKLGMGHFKLVVLSPLNFVPNATVARGKNSALYLPTYQGVLTPTELDTFLSRFFLHELGHSFGLRDEYAFQRKASGVIDSAAANGPSSSLAYQPAQPNCAPDQATAKKWWGAYIDAHVPGVGLQAGCAGKPSYYYPQTGTLMSDNPQVATYGIVSEDYIRGTLDCFYGSSSTIHYPTTGRVAVPGLVSSCSAFRALYPNFWSE